MTDDALAIFAAIATTSLGLALILGGLSKLVGHARLRQVLAGISFLPRALNAPIAVIIPLAELAVGILMLVQPRVGATGAIALLAGGAAVALMSVLLQLRVPCICFSTAGGDYLSTSTALRNLILAALASLAYLDLPVVDGLLTFVISISVVALSLSASMIIRLTRDYSQVRQS